MNLIDTVHTPEDLKKLPEKSLAELAEEYRQRIIDVVHHNGGHLASNLGIVELTMAMHRVFDSPEDAFIWDVGHQCYVHKLITGRNDRFDTLRQLDGLAGFPKPEESPHDIVETGHSSTSISEGLGLLAARRRQGQKGKVVVVIGDGALTGGMAFEAMNHAGHLKDDLIIILNDNNMSICPNVGALSSSSSLGGVSAFFGRVTTSRAYQTFRDNFDHGLKVIPFLGHRLLNIIVRLKKGLKALLFSESIFTDLGLQYVGPIDGHSFAQLERVLKNAKNVKKPIVIHVVTQKGRGFESAVENPGAFHGVAPRKFPSSNFKPLRTYTQVFGDKLKTLMSADSRIAAVTAAMAKGTGLASIQNEFPNQFFDVGIAEQHGLTFSAGLARGGFHPVAAIYSTFMQRGADQLIHDIALPRLPVVIAMDRAGLVGGDGETHQGIFDIPMFKSIPGISFIAPGSVEDLELMLSWAFEQDHPVLVRYPKTEAPEVPELTSPVLPGQGVWISRKKEASILVITVGALLDQVIGAGVLAGCPDYDIYHQRFIAPLDLTPLMDQIPQYSEIHIVEEGVVLGGIGETIGSRLKVQVPQADIHYHGLPGEFPVQATRKELLELYQLDSSAFCSKIKKEARQHS